MRKDNHNKANSRCSERSERAWSKRVFNKPERQGVDGDMRCIVIKIGGLLWRR